MSRTINGKDMNTIIKELQEDFPNEAIEKREYDGIYYIGVDAYRERLNNVVGIDHYNELYEEVKLVKAQDSYATKTKCRIEFLDDDYNIIMVKESTGGSNIAFPKIDSTNTDDKGNAIKVPGTTTNSLPNDFDSACQDAFKRICKKQLNMGKRQLDVAKLGTLYTIKITKPFNEYKGHLFGEGEFNGKHYNIAIFKNSVEVFKSAYELPKSGQEIAFYGKEGKTQKNQDQIIFEKVYRSENTRTKENTAQHDNTSINTPTSDSNTDNEGKNNYPVLELENTTVLQSFGDKGHMCFKAVDRKNKLYNMVIESSVIPHMDQVLWKHFSQRASKETGVHGKFAIDTTTLSDRCLIKDICS